MQTKKKHFVVTLNFLMDVNGFYFIMIINTLFIKIAPKKIIYYNIFFSLLRSIYEPFRYLCKSLHAV